MKFHDLIYYTGNCIKLSSFIVRMASKSPLRLGLVLEEKDINKKKPIDLKSHLGSAGSFMHRVHKSVLYSLKK